MPPTPPQPLGIRELAERAKHEGAYDLAQGVIDAPPPAALIRSMRELPLEETSAYNNKRGVPAYRDAVQGYLAARGWPVAVEQIMGTAGATGGVVGALLADCRPGDRVILPEPFFIYHQSLLEFLGFRIAYFPLPLDGEPDWEALEVKMNGARALILTTPANPTGHVAPPRVVARLAEKAASSGCLLILDEMYREFIWDEETPDDSARGRVNLKNTVVLRSFSKTFAIPGWRAAFAVTSPERIERMAMRHDAVYIGGSTIAQHALAATLTQDAEELAAYVRNLREQLRSNMTQLAAAFRATGMEPLPVRSAYYMLLKHHRSSDVKTVEDLIAHKVVTTPACLLYADSARDTGFIRIHFAVSPNTVRGVQEQLAAYRVQLPLRRGGA